MKYYKTLKVYKASNVMFNPQTMLATSYRWWNMLQKINGKIVFNSYTYSSSTSKHQYKLLNLLHQLNINIDHYIEAPKGLQRLDEARKHYEGTIRVLKMKIASPKTRKTTNAKRQLEIDKYQEKIRIIDSLSNENNVRIQARLGVK